MAVNEETFYDKEVTSILSSGNRLLGSSFRVHVEKCPNLSKMIASCSPALPGRHLVEPITGPHGIEVPEPGPLKTGGQFTISFNDGFQGLAFTELIEWSLGSIDLKERKYVRIYGAHELGNQGFDVTYLHCFPELEDADLDYSSKTTPAKFSFILHFGNRKWTKGQPLENETP